MLSDLFDAEINVVVSILVGIFFSVVYPDWRLLMHSNTLEKHVFLSARNIGDPTEHLVLPRRPLECCLDSFLHSLLRCLVRLFAGSSSFLYEQRISLEQEELLPDPVVIIMTRLEVQRHFFHIDPLLEHVEDVYIENWPYEVIQTLPQLVSSPHERTLESNLFHFFEVPQVLFTRLDCRCFQELDFHI